MDKSLNDSNLDDVLELARFGAVNLRALNYALLRATDAKVSLIDDEEAGVAIALDLPEGRAFFIDSGRFFDVILSDGHMVSASYELLSDSGETQPQLNQLDSKTYFLLEALAEIFFRNA